MLKKNAQKVCPSRVFFDSRPPLRRWFEWRCHIVSTLRCPPKASLPRRSTTSSSPLQIKMHNLIVIKHCQTQWHSNFISNFPSTFFSYVIWLKDLTNEHSRQAFFEHFFENFKVILKAFFSEAKRPPTTLGPRPTPNPSWSWRASGSWCSFTPRRGPTWWAVPAHAQSPY